MYGIELKLFTDIRKWIFNIERYKTYNSQYYENHAISIMYSGQERLHTMCKIYGLNMDYKTPPIVSILQAKNKLGLSRTRIIIKASIEIGRAHV